MFKTILQVPQFNHCTTTTIVAIIYIFTIIMIISLTP